MEEIKLGKQKEYWYEVAKKITKFMKTNKGTLAALIVVYPTMLLTVLTVGSFFISISRDYMRFIANGVLSLSGSCAMIYTLYIALSISFDFKEYEQKKSENPASLSYKIEAKVYFHAKILEYVYFWILSITFFFFLRSVVYFETGWILFIYTFLISISLSYYLNKYRKKILKFANVTIFVAYITFLITNMSTILKNQEIEKQALTINYVLNKGVHTYRYSSPNFNEQPRLLLTDSKNKPISYGEDNKKNRWYLLDNNEWVSSRYADKFDENSNQTIDAIIYSYKDSQLLYNPRFDTSKTGGIFPAGMEKVVNHREIVNGKTYYQINDGNWVSGDSSYIKSETSRGEKTFI